MVLIPTFWQMYIFALDSELWYKKLLVLEKRFNGALYCG